MELAERLYGSGGKGVYEIALALQVNSPPKSWLLHRRLDVISRIT